MLFTNGFRCVCVERESERELDKNGTLGIGRSTFNPRTKRVKTCRQFVSYKRNPCVEVGTFARS